MKLYCSGKKLGAATEQNEVNEESKIMLKWSMVLKECIKNKFMSVTVDHELSWKPHTNNKHKKWPFQYYIKLKMRCRKTELFSHRSVYYILSGSMGEVAKLTQIKSITKEN